MIYISALLKLKLDAILAIGVGETEITGVNIGYCKIENQELTYEEIENLSLDKVMSTDNLDKVLEIESELRKSDLIEDDTEYDIECPVNYEYR